MNYTIPWLIDKVAAGEDPSYLFFWGHTQKVSGVIDNASFSQWWPADFVIDIIKYPTAEHWMMACKARLFNDEKRLKEILKTGNPGRAKALGRQVANFDEKIWMKHAFGIVVKGNLEKFSQNAKLKNYLLETGDKVLVEASPVDVIWGIGMAKDHKNILDPTVWRGQNLLGFALMEVRDILSKNHDNDYFI